MALVSLIGATTSRHIQDYFNMLFAYGATVDTSTGSTTVLTITMICGAPMTRKNIVWITMWTRTIQRFFKLVRKQISSIWPSHTSSEVTAFVGKSKEGWESESTFTAFLTSSMTVPSTGSSRLSTHLQGGFASTATNWNSVRQRRIEDIIFPRLTHLLLHFCEPELSHEALSPAPFLFYLGFSIHHLEISWGQHSRTCS